MPRFEPQIIQNVGLPFSFGNGNGSEFNWHRNLEILYFTNGSGKVVCNGITFDMKKGDIFVVNSNSLHRVINNSKTNYFFLKIDADFCIENGILTDEIVFMNCINDVEAVKKIECVIDEIENEKKYQNAGIRCSVLSLLIYLARNFTDTVFRYNKKVGSIVIDNIRISMGYINAHFTEQLTIKEIADEVRLSEGHFAHSFKRITGITPVGYINMLRCEKAKKMFLSDAQSVTQVQQECGFSNASYFSKVFKKYCGKTPKEFMTESKNV